MQFLFVTNGYPPFHAGGYEELCEEVANGLRGRGHRVVVLTTVSQASTKPDKDVLRVLHPVVRSGFVDANVGFFFGKETREQENIHALERAHAKIRPDVVMFWGMWNLPYSLAVRAEQWADSKTAYYIADYWPSLPDAYALHWQEPARRVITRIPKKIMARAARLWRMEQRPARHLKFRHVMCVSEYVRQHLLDAGLPFANARVIRNAIDLDMFDAKQNPPERHHPNDAPFALLLAGRLAPQKGAEVAIKAIRQMKNVSLTLLGAGSLEYESELRNLVSNLKLQDRVVFAGRLPRVEMPRYMAGFDALVVPSTWPEPLPRIAQEAMGLGLPVLASRAGGLPELVVDNETGLLFAPGDETDLARQLARLIEDSALRECLARAAREHAQKKYSMQRMLQEVEEFCQQIILN